MKIVGVTGGIGSGKSTVCKVFETLGIPIYQADDRAKFLMQNNESLISAIKKQFGHEAYNKGTLNRTYLAKVIFSSAEQTAKINALVHPAVSKDFSSWVSVQKAQYIIKEAALMIESGSYEKLDFLINVFAPVETRIKRIQERDPQRSLEEINAIISKQVSEEERTQIAHAIINNDGNQLLIPQVLALHKQLID